MADIADLFSISLAPAPVVQACKKDVDRSSIRVEELAARLRDLERIAELEAIVDERTRDGSPRG